MARLLLIVAVCYCTYCAQLAVSKETVLRRDHKIQTNNNLITNQFEKYALAHEDDSQNTMPIEFGEQNIPKSDVNSYINIQNQLNNRQNKGDNEKRIKRHAGGHGHFHKETDNQHVEKHSTWFVKKIFEQFGNADKQTMNIVGFESMLKHLGLYRLLDEDSASNSPSLTINKKTSNETCLSSIELVSRVSSMTHVDLDNSSELSEKNQTKTDTHVILPELESKITTENSTNNNTAAINSIKQNMFLNQNDLWSICPIILYQLTANNSLERSGCIDPTTLPLDNHHHPHHHTEEEDRTFVWIYASLSIIGASLCGLLGVAVIPCMDRHYYQHILQFLVALAIGTLAGDALLHLMPHAMMTFSAHESGHDSMTWKGLVAALGIIFFFLTERLLIMVAEWRKRIHKRDDPPGKVRVMRDPDSASVNHSLNGEKQCIHKYSSYPYCYDEIALDTKDDHHHHHHHPNSQGTSGKENGLKSSNASSPKVKGRNRNPIDLESTDGAQSLLARHSNYTISSSAYLKNNEKTDAETPGNHTVMTNLDSGSVDSCGCEPKKEDDHFTVILREHESKHHGHSHTHGHVHSPPKTLSAVAWMVVMGDGLHNFTDGMAIGAAFSNNIAGGFSTAIAVFCHELPHELGDFAVLIKAGMSARRAVYYNVLSSVLSLLGMILGILVGNTPEASAWIFAAAAGMFIYIALVDMMPELTTTHNESCAVTQCILQTLGMFTGVGIMLVIALFEDDLKVMFTAEKHHAYHH